MGFTLPRLLLVCFALHSGVIAAMEENESAVTAELASATTIFGQHQVHPGRE